MLVSIVIVLVLVVLNGFFAMSELAIVSARRARLETMAKAGNRGAARALRLAEDPTELPLDGAGRHHAHRHLRRRLQRRHPLRAARRGAAPGAARSPTIAGTLAFALVVIATTYVSLIIGELVPKRLALRNAEGIAAFVSGPMTLLAAVGKPIVWFLRVSTEAVLRLLAPARRGAERGHRGGGQGDDRRGHRRRRLPRGRARAARRA